MEMHLTGRNMDAEEAERAGLVSRVVPAEDLLKEAKDVALKIAEKSMLSTMGIKESKIAPSKWNDRGYII